MRFDQIVCWLSVGGYVVAFHVAFADEYRLDPAPTFEQGTALVPMAYAKSDDPAVCRIYLENLRYYARRNTAMSCERPIAPHLSGTIADVEWENLDPVVHKELFQSVIALASFGKDATHAALSWRTDELRKGVSVFRRARLSLSGYFDNGNNSPKAVPDGFQIVQYGINTLDPRNPASNWRCKPRRGGPTSDHSYLKLYLVSADLKHVHSPLNDYAQGGNTGQYLRLVNGRPHVEQVLPNGNSVLMQLRTAFPIGLESVCLYLFRRSS